MMPAPLHAAGCEIVDSDWHLFRFCLAEVRYIRQTIMRKELCWILSCFCRTVADENLIAEGVARDKLTEPAIGKWIEH